MNSIFLTLAICASLAVALPEGKHGGRPFPGHNQFAQIPFNGGSSSSEEVNHRPNGQPIFGHPGRPFGRPVKPPPRPNGQGGSFLTNEQMCFFKCIINPEQASTKGGCACGNLSTSPTTTVAAVTGTDAASPVVVVTDTTTVVSETPTVSGVASDTITDTTVAPTQNTT